MQARLYVVAAIFGVALSCAAWGQDATQPEQTTVPTIQKQTSLVLVDTVVTTKHGEYVTDLTQKDFRVWEDNKEQPIKSFSFEKDATASNEHKRYIILFFDNSTMSITDQANA